MKKFRLFSIDLNKEENWINNIIANGYRLTKVDSMQYTFVKTDIPENNFIRMDFRTFNKKSEYREYISLFEDSGWYHVGGSMYNGKQYFMKIRPDSNSEIFSDSRSYAERYKRLSAYWLSMFCCYIPLVTVLISNDAININNMLHPKNLYLTPGLWDLTGSKFWFAFLFETPFALFRGFWGLIIFALLLIYGILVLKSYYSYKKECSRY